MDAYSSEPVPAERTPHRYWALAGLLCSFWVVGLLGLFAARQAPIGAVRGRLVAAETGRPLAKAQLFLAPADASVPGRRRRLSVDAEGRFHLRGLHAGNYVVSASSQAHRLRERRITIAEGETLHLALEMAAMNPFLDLYCPQRVFLPGEPVQVTAHGFTRAEALDVETFRLDAMRVVADAQGSLWRVLAPDNPRQWGQPEQPIPLRSIAGLTLVAETRVVPPRDAEGVFTRRIPVPAREPGLYLVACRADGIERLTWMMVTDLGLITKHVGRDETTGPACLAYAVDLTSGRPATDAEVAIHQGGQRLSSARCDAAGLAALPLPSADEEALVIAQRGRSLAFVRLWGGSGEAARHRVFLYTDRPVYRPGHRVAFKGIARVLAGEGLRPPTPGPVRVEVRDPRNTLVYSTETTSSDLGSFDGAFELSTEAATGSYTLLVDLDGEQHEHSFAVASYRKPEYRVTVRPERDVYTRGESGWFEVEARYFFGAPVVGATVRYTVMRSPLWPWMERDEDASLEEEDFYYGDAPGEGEVIAEGEARTDARGRCLVRFETTFRERAGDAQEAFFEPDDYDYRYSVEATVADAGRFTADGSAAVTVRRGELAVSLEPEWFVQAPGKPLAATAVVRDHAGKARGGIPVELSLVRRRWRDGAFTLAVAGKATARTDAAGRATARLRPPSPGDYQVRALVRDERGNEIPASAWVWVTGATEAAPMPSGASLRVVADRKEYRPGDTATFVIHTSMVGTTALITAETDGILTQKTLALSEPATTFRLPITRAHAPNFWLSVCCVRNKEFVHRQIPVRVSKRPWTLRVEVAADRQTYAPGDTATYRVRTLGPDGKPVPAEVSLGVVDESVYAIREDRANILTAFYPSRYSQVSTEFSFPQIYLSGGDKSGVPGEVRKEFPDTALWVPSLRTNARGEATVRLKIPDSLTSWRATARAHTRETFVGQAASKVTCRKELMVRLQTPRSFTARDSATVSAMVHNESGAEQQVQVSLQASGVRLEGEARRRLRLRPGQVQRLDWQITTEQQGRCRLVCTAQADGGPRDAVEQQFPILPHGRARREAIAGTLSGDGTAEAPITLRPDSTGVMEVGLYLAPSLAAGMLSALNYLAEYPYGCTEQTLSAFLPDLVVHRAMKRLGIGSARLEQAIPDMVNTGLQRLARFQHDDGGWGWWEFDRSDVRMTAYVVQGLLTAQREGFAVNPEVLQRGVAWLRERERDWMVRGIPRLGTPRRLAYGAPPDEPPAAFLRPPTRHDPAPLIPLERSEALLALAEAGTGDVVTAALTTPTDATADVEDARILARLCLAAAAAGQATEANRLRERLMAQAQESSLFCHWQNDPEATALALQALLSGRATAAVGEHLASPRAARLEPKIVRWLLAQRDGDHWRSTWATSRVLFALVDFQHARGEMAPAFTVRPSFNGKPLRPVRFGRADLFRPELRLEVPSEWVRPGENLLRLEKQGRGDLHYTLRLRQYSGQEDVPVLLADCGITVARTYHLLRPGRDPDTGAFRLVPSEKAVTRMRAGQSYLGRIVIQSPRAYEHVVIEEPLPAGCEPLDRGRVDEYDWRHWWTEVDVRDSQIAFFARTLPSGKQVLEYYLRAAVPGRYHVMPTEVSGMYDPEVRGGGAETRVEIR